MRKLLITLVCATASTFSYAQQYTTALGVRGDWSNLDVAYSDINLKHFINGTSNAFEATLGFGRRHLWFQGMYERNFLIGKGVEWYWGIGGDIGYWNKNYDRSTDNRENVGVWTGIDANIGIEYTFPSFPINIALDAGPTVRMYPFVEVGPLIGFSVRYAFRRK
jgi:hypothetical protein